MKRLQKRIFYGMFFIAAMLGTSTGVHAISTTPGDQDSTDTATRPVCQSISLSTSTVSPGQGVTVTCQGDGNTNNYVIQCDDQYKKEVWSKSGTCTYQTAGQKNPVCFAKSNSNPNYYSSDGCTGNLNVGGGLIEIVKTAENGSDTQSVASGGKAKFKIKVKNIGSEPLKNIKVSDTLSPNCSRTRNDTLNQGQEFSYTCESNSVSNTFVNTASVYADGVNSGQRTPTASDRSTVVLGAPAFTGTGLDCDQSFNMGMRRYNGSYNFTDSLTNPNSYPVLGKAFAMSFKNHDYLQKQASGKESEFHWTDSFRNSANVVPARSTKGIIEAKGWKIVKKPATRTNGTSGSYDFRIKYAVKHNKNTTNWNPLPDDVTHTECAYYSVSWCGDGVRDSGDEACDPNDSSKSGFGNSGCSNVCEPINTPPVVVVTPTTTCDSLNVNTTNIYAGSNVSFTCSGENVDSTRVTCGNGQSVNSATGRCSYPHAGTYQMTCTMTGDSGSATSNSCKKSISVNTTLTPSIQVIKTALDGTDIQTVGTSNTARFKIAVTNVGNEALSRNIILSDSLSSNCAGTLVLPTNKPSTFSDFRYFGNGNHSDQILSIGEGFEYTCTKSNVTAAFINTVSVRGVGSTSGNSVSDSDATTVQKEVVAVEIPTCPYTASGDGFVVDLTSAGRLWSKEGQLNRGTVNLGRTYPEGKYRVTLFAADAYQSRINVSQPNEIIKVNFKNNGSTLATSNATSDVPDNVAVGYVSEIVNNALMINGSFNSIEVVHAAYIDNSNANSVNPVCGLIEKLPETLIPKISIDKTDYNDAQDMDTTRENDTQTLLVGHTSRFKITVTNTGTEALKNIIIGDAQAGNCAGSVSLPSTYPNTWSNFVVTGNGDQYLDPGESFSYRCEKSNTEDSYTNTASVFAQGKNTETNVNDDDDSAVIVDKDSDSDICPYTATGDQILIEFGNHTLGDWSESARTKSYSNFGTIPAGRYQISLAAFDGYKDRSRAQPNEQYYVVFKDSNEREITRTNATEDIRDDSNNAAWYGVVNNNFYISQNITNLSTDHIYPDNRSANSLKAKCMLLEPIGITSDPEISIDKRDANDEDQDGGASDTQTVAPNGNAVFKITVTNSGLEDLKDVVITDELATNCAGSVTLPNTKPSTFGSFVSTDNGDAVFNPGESFTYTCEEANTTATYINIAGVTATGVDSDEGVDDSDPSPVILGGITGPSIIIDKIDSNGGLDKDGTVGNDTQSVETGANAEFKIRVTNNGTENLTDIVITDALAANCAGAVNIPNEYPTSFNDFTIGGQGDWYNDVLEPNEFIQYTCIKGNTTDDYTNTAGVTAVGDDSGTSVDDDDESEVKIVLPGTGPDISIDKRDANTSDIDLVDGNDTQTILTGSSSDFIITVLNIGNENLNNIKVVDALAPNCNANITLPVTAGSIFTAGGDGDATDSVLEPGESVSYLCLKENITEGYTNNAIVTADGVTTGTNVDDDDDTIIIVEVASAAIEIIKTDANDSDSDRGDNDTQTVQEGEEAVFKITVINTGNENLNNITVTDTVAPNCAGTITLPSDYPSTWSAFEIVDGTSTDAVLEPGESFSYECSKANTTEDYTNTAGVVGTGTESGETPEDDDTSKVLLEEPSIKIDKTDANGADADGGIEDSQIVAEGADAVFKITVTNDGTEDLTNIVITDALASNCAGSVTLPSTYESTFVGFAMVVGNNDAIFSPGESFSYTCSKANTTDSYTNTAGVTADGVNSGTGVEDDDTSNVAIPGPAIMIDKTDANSADLDDDIDDSQTVEYRAGTEFKITVTNSGTEDLTDITITDALAPNCAGTVTLPGTYPSTFNGFALVGNADAILSPGEYFSYTCTASDTTQEYTNLAGVNATGVTSGETVEDDDTSEVLIEGEFPSIEVVKTDDNLSRDSDNVRGNDTQTVSVGEKAVFKITVTNNGTEGLTNIKLTDLVETSCGGDVTLPNTKPSSFLNFTHIGTDDIFDPGESFSYNCSKLNTTEDYTNTVDVQATGVDTTTTVDDSDTTEVKIPAGSVCNGLVIEDAEGEPTHKTDIECTGTDVETFEIDCDNGEIFTQAGSNGGVETFTKECSYSSNGNYNPTCKINGEAQAQNSCQGTVKVGSSSSSSGGFNCSSIEIEKNSSSDNTLNTDVTCIASEDVKSFRLEYGTRDDDRFEIISGSSKREHTFRDITYTNTSGSSETYQVKCHVSDNTRDDDDRNNDGAWKSKLKCQDNVTVGDGGGSSGGGICGDGTVQRPNSNDFREECDKVRDDNDNLNFPNTCNSDCTLRDGGSSSGGPSGFCGDGVVQRPNDNGQNEECDRKVNANGTFGDWPTFCYPTPGANACKVKTETRPAENEIKITPGGNQLIGHGQDALHGETPRLTVTGGDRIYLDKKFCTYNLGNRDILTGGYGECTDGIIGLLRPGEYVENTKARNFFKGNINTIPSGSTYSDTQLSTTLEGVQNGFFAKKTNVRVAKPSVATVGGGVSLQKESNVTGKIADVQELATIKSATQKASDSFGSADNTNFQGASLGDTADNGDSGSLSSSADEVNEGKALEQAEEDKEEYIESTEVVEDTAPSTNVANSLAEGESYNGIKNVFIFDENLVLNGLDVDAENGEEARTYIINGGDLIIKGNITGDTPIAFIVKGGSIKVSNNVSEMNGTYVVIGGGKVEGLEDDLTSNQLVIKGGVYGDTTDLVSKRTYISNQGNGSNQISVGTIVWKGASLFSKTPPLLRSFINEYTEETRVAR